MAKRVTIELWGTYPPPYGGVSIHLKRLFENLKNKDEYNLLFKNFGIKEITSSKNDLKNIKVNNKILEFLSLPFSPKKIVHIHSQNLLAWTLLLILGFKHILIITLHNQKLRKEHKLKKILAKLLLKRTKVIFLNDADYQHFLEKDYSIYNKFVINPAFIKPLKEEYIGITNIDILSFRQKKQNIISTFGKITKNDIYGIFSLIELVKDLKEKKFDIGLICIISKIDENESYLGLLNKIERYNLKDNILLIREDLPNAFEVWGISDLFIRATSSDIEGISIKEALMMGTPVIASNVCTRPNECITYEYGNYADLEMKVIQTISNKNRIMYEPVEAYTKIHEIYCNLISTFFK
jgi:glycosyltransferase involved in cell wall biosynthesis